jgi:hypothetical protein
VAWSGSRQHRTQEQAPAACELRVSANAALVSEADPAHVATTLCDFRRRGGAETDCASVFGIIASMPVVMRGAVPTFKAEERCTCAGPDPRVIWPDSQTAKRPWPGPRVLKRAGTACERASRNV